MDLGKLGTAVADWKTMVGDLAKLKPEVSRGLVAKSEAARWEGVNATVTRPRPGAPIPPSRCHGQSPPGIEGSR
ncbi:hypothetical protein AB0D24_43425 [Streptomyces javensis]|uniref:hypothetical protein n=1 Tax=Streptomyces javensis TaxID=114698 RepID=UPI00340E1D52